MLTKAEVLLLRDLRARCHAGTQIIIIISITNLNYQANLKYIAGIKLIT